MRKVGLKRNTIDKFYTIEQTVKICINTLKTNLIIKKGDIIIEPSAGNGSFIDSIKLLTNNYLFFDIEPENNNIIKQNFLELDFKKYKINKYNKIHFIGNPPFGRQSSTVIKFIKKSCSICDSFSYILPNSFKKDSLKKHIPLNFHLIKQIDLPENSFKINDIIHNVPCIFQIWEKKKEKRVAPIKLKPLNFIFVKKDEEPHISFRRVGVNAGKIDINCDKSKQSHYFIKLLNYKNSLILNKKIKELQNIKYEHNNTSGPKSISKQELIKEFNKILNI